ncbi:hypothetical protein GCM10010178_91990 [Lentzea flava]|uniref:ABC transporter domain-containing protein n=1 Tax=Lentzea flava TaxID=103732 RepID=A0ABQ2VI40_9PSEU|nr:hypothetical protein GCM10010178_91990 [Lentzea flava]
MREVTDALELTEHLNRKPRNLSGGQRQRVAMDRAIVRSSRVFPMDEPLSNLDGNSRVQIARVQRDLGGTTVYVTHDQTEAMTLGRRVAVMKGGVLQQAGLQQQLTTGGRISSWPVSSVHQDEPGDGPAARRG